MNANLLFNIMPDILANVIAHTLYIHIKTKLSLIVDYYLPIKLYLNKRFHFITEFSVDVQSQGPFWYGSGMIKTLY